MYRVFTTVSRFLRTDAGQDLTEYGLLAGLIVVVAVAALTSVGGVAQNFWQSIAASCQTLVQNV